MKAVLKSRPGSVLYPVLAFIGVSVLLVILTIASIVGYTLSVLNTEVSLRNAIAAQDRSNTAQYDKMWKAMQETAGVASQYSEDFKAIYPELIAGRYKSGGGLMKWIQEHNPTFDTSLYQRVQIVIESERAATKQGFDKVLDLKREHDNLLDRPVSGLVVSIFGKNRDKTNPTIVTSTATVESFSTGKDDRILGK